MSFTPMTGIGSTIVVAGNTLVVRDFSIAMTRETVKASGLVDVYEKFLSGRINATISANVIVDSTTVSDIMSDFLGQSTTGVVVSFTLTDDGAANSYSGSAYVTSATHSMTADDVDLIALEMQVTGEIT